MAQSEHLIKVIVEMAIFLEFTHEDSLCPDAAVEMMESINAFFSVFMVEWDL